MFVQPCFFKNIAKKKKGRKEKRDQIYADLALQIRAGPKFQFLVADGDPRYFIFQHPSLPTPSTKLRKRDPMGGGVFRRSVNLH